MAEYSKVMNLRLIDASSTLTPAILAKDKGAFFKSIIGTLNHIMIGDILWLQRFSFHPSNYHSLSYLNQLNKPKSLDQILYTDLNEFKLERIKLDKIVIDWSKELTETDLELYFQYIDTKGNKHNKIFGSLVLHLFLHQIHHRGQITTLLSQENVSFGDTDLPEFLADKLEH